MSCYDELFDEVLHQTVSGVLNWEQLSRREYSELILNTQQVMRLYRAPFSRGNIDYQLLLVEKKEEDADFFISRYEHRKPELLVLHGDKLVSTLSDSDIDRTKLLHLLGAVDSRSDRCKELYGHRASAA